MQQNKIVRTGNEFAVLFDGREVGLVQSVSAQDSYGLQPASGIGDIHVKQHVPTMASHTLQVSNMVLYRGDLMDIGIIPENGDVVLEGLVFDIEQYDKRTGALIRKYVGCSYDSGGFEVQKHAIVMQSATFQALDVKGKNGA